MVTMRKDLERHSTERLNLWAKDHFARYEMGGLDPEQAYIDCAFMATRLLVKLMTANIEMSEKERKRYTKGLTKNLLDAGYDYIVANAAPAPCPAERLRTDGQ
jgi:hypothetical protein